MRRDGWRQALIEGWAFAAVAILAFVGGLLIGDLGGSPETKTVYVSNAAGEGEEASAASGEAEPAGSESAAAGSGGASGAQLFTSVGCAGCHTLSAASSTGTTGPNLSESLAPDDNTEGIEEMITHPNDEVVEGYPADVMPQNYSESLSPTEVHELAEFLVTSTKAKPSP